MTSLANMSDSSRNSVEEPFLPNSTYESKRLGLYVLQQKRLQRLLRVSAILVVALILVCGALVARLAYLKGTLVIKDEVFCESDPIIEYSKKDS